VALTNRSQAANGNGPAAITTAKPPAAPVDLPEDGGSQES
jgi:hypothetical protein